MRSVGKSKESRTPGRVELSQTSQPPLPYAQGLCLRGSGKEIVYTPGSHGVRGGSIRDSASSLDDLAAWECANWGRVCVAQRIVKTSARMGRKLKKHSKEVKIGESEEYVRSIQRLATSNLNLLTDVISKLVSDFSKTPAYSVEDRRKALSRLLIAILQSVESLSASPSAKPQWNLRDRTQKITPLRFLEIHYSEEIAAGTLVKSSIRKSDYSLYKALSNPHWMSSEKPENLFSNLPSKKKSNDVALKTIPTGVTRGGIVKLFPPEIRELFRLLSVAETRRRRSLKG